jgi:hypothetical protein
MGRIMKAPTSLCARSEARPYATRSHDVRAAQAQLVEATNNRGSVFVPISPLLPLGTPAGLDRYRAARSFLTTRRRARRHREL